MDMKGNRKIIAMVICLFIFQNSFGQSFKFPNEKNDYDRYDICKVCVDYVKDHYGKSNKSVGVRTANYIKLSNNKKLVVVELSILHNKVEIIPDITGNGILDQYGNRHEYLKKNKEVMNHEVFGVFVDGDGEIQKSIQLPNLFDIEKLPNNRILLLRKYRADLKEYVYKEILCYDVDGNLIWAYDNDFIIWEYCLTDKNMYAVGGRDEGYYKVFNLSNGERIEEKQTKPNVETRYTNISLKTDGVHVTEAPRGSSTKTHIFPYVASDKEYQRNQGMKQYTTMEKTDVKNDSRSSTSVEVNNCWYVFGTRGELEGQGIIINNKVNENTLPKHKDYFTEANQTTKKEIKLYSSKAEVLTNHPSGSYTLQRETPNRLSLKISDSNEFWSNSKYLVIVVE